MARILTLSIAATTLIACQAPPPPPAAPPRTALRNLDARQFRSAAARPGPAQLAAADGLRRRLGALTVRYSPSGATRALSNPTGYLAAAQKGLSAEENARRFVRDHLDLLGLHADDLNGWE